MAATGASPVFVEEELSRRWDRCITDAFLKFGGGLLLGSVFSLLFFKKRKWPMILGGGFGIGMAYSNCERDVNNLLQPPCSPEEKERAKTC